MFFSFNIIIEHIFKGRSDKVEKSTFAERLNLIVKEKKIRQIDLCRKTGIGKSAMSQYLHGSFEPKQQNLHALALALDVSEAWLMGYDVPRQRKIHGSANNNISSPSDSSESALTTSSSADLFYFRAIDNSMESAHIPEGATAFVRRKSTYSSGDIVCFSFANSSPALRTIYQYEDTILLLATASGYDPIICKNADLTSGVLKIKGAVVRVVIEM